MNAIMPDGYFYEDHIVFGDPGNGSVIARGYAVNFPDLSASDDQAYIDLESDIQLMLGSVKPDERLQLEFYTSSNLFPGPSIVSSKTRVKTARWNSAARFGTSWYFVIEIAWLARP